MDPEQKRKSLRNITYGVYVLTVKSEEDYAGAMVTWVSQSDELPLNLRSTGWSYGG